MNYVKKILLAVATAGVLGICGMFWTMIKTDIETAKDITYIQENIKEIKEILKEKADKDDLAFPQTYEQWERGIK